MSAVSEPLPVPGAPTPPATRSRGVQEPAGPRGTKRPSPPAALPTDGPLREQHAQSPHTGQQSPAGDLTNIGGGPSFASGATQLDAPFHIPPDFEFLLSDPSPFALPSDGLGPAITPSLAMPPIGGSGPGSGQHGRTEQVLLPPQAAGAFLHTYNPLPTQAPAMADNVRSGTAGESEFYMAGQHGAGIFGLDPFGYDLDGSMSLLSSISQSQVGTRNSNDAQVHPYFVDAETAMSSGSGSVDPLMPVDNEQTFLSNFPLSVLGSENWGAYFAQDGVNNPGM
ncbi:hypothetical protein GSI_13293 [Ganoderma sinense ZZ0214-1]|uniref:Uncharacterized protein n=1 Tax=Ganoderma sinense ZZ0214-1 TaxID=1077348 RepID=A0A2G8RV72_9APHY|nr:hypothetical protein GSI_13293 [Ganoderma sinense ZZ0214-1]